MGDRPLCSTQPPRPWTRRAGPKRPCLTAAASACPPAACTVGWVRPGRAAGQPSTRCVGIPLPQGGWRGEARCREAWRRCWGFTQGQEEMVISCWSVQEVRAGGQGALEEVGSNSALLSWGPLGVGTGNSSQHLMPDEGMAAAWCVCVRVMGPTLCIGAPRRVPPWLRPISEWGPGRFNPPLLSLPPMVFLESWHILSWKEPLKVI